MRCSGWNVRPISSIWTACTGWDAARCGVMAWRPMREGRRLDCARRQPRSRHCLADGAVPVRLRAPGAGARRPGCGAGCHRAQDGAGRAERDRRPHRLGLPAILWSGGADLHTGDVRSKSSRIHDEIKATVTPARAGAQSFGCLPTWRGLDSGMPRNDGCAELS